MRQEITAYITKYALSSGISEERAEVCSDDIIKTVRDGDRYSAFFHGRDWHRDRQSALDRAEEMRKAKIASLQKQIAKLEKLSFKH